MSYIVLDDISNFTYQSIESAKIIGEVSVAAAKGIITGGLRAATFPFNFRRSAKAAMKQAENMEPNHSLSERVNGTADCLTNLLLGFTHGAVIATNVFYSDVLFWDVNKAQRGDAHLDFNLKYFGAVLFGNAIDLGIAYGKNVRDRSRVDGGDTHDN